MGDRLATDAHYTLGQVVSVSGFMGYLKGKSSLMLYGQFGNLKFKYRNKALQAHLKNLRLCWRLFIRAITGLILL